METVKLQISGMTCQHCVKRVSDALNALDGVTATVSLEQAMATIQSAAAIESAKLINTVASAGYSAQLIK